MSVTPNAQEFRCFSDQCGEGGDPWQCSFFPQSNEHFMGTVITPAPRIEHAPSRVTVAFVALAKAPKLLASLSAKIPPDVVPMPIERLTLLCRTANRHPTGINGVVVCVPQLQLPEIDRSILKDLAQIIPVFYVYEDRRDKAVTFFDECRKTPARTPRMPPRIAYRRPVAMALWGDAAAQRLLTSENVSPGGIFVKDPNPINVENGMASLRFLGLRKVPELLVRIRWIRETKTPGLALGYGCSFDNVSALALRRLFADATTRATPEP